MKVSRRRFLATAARGTALVSVGFGFPDLFSRALLAGGEGSSGRDSRILVVLELAGGNDGLNTVIPYANDLYHAARPGLALGAGKVLRLDDEFGLHPSLEGVKNLWDAGRAAVVHGAGYPNPNRSHFEAMDIWHTARPLAEPETSGIGWLGRYLDEADFARRVRIPAVALGSQLPLALSAARTPVPAIDRPESFGLGEDPGSPLDRESRRKTLQDLLTKGSGNSPKTSAALEFLRGASRDAVLSAEEIQKMAAGYASPTLYPGTQIGQALRFVAQMMAADLGSRLYYVSYAGFDTHAGQGPAHQRLFEEMGSALDAFFKDMDHHSRADQVLVLSFSEFGRRVRSNGSGGTDHGAAGPMFLFSGKVKPGFACRHPDLADLDDGDLRFTVDFRSVYASVLEDWLGAPSEAVLGGRFPKVEGLFA
ncbi:MAG: DUF1501 domain-containing protein [Planctomycetes bacterium]|nr:DUF1501 domain-containing protein [Planctomycetota bacterium]